MFAQTDTLFQVLDGVLADSNLMVCATTNYKDRLDPALIRPGRFDHSIEVVGLAYHEAVRVCESFNVKPEDIELEKFPVPINPGALQAKIIKFKTLE
jgi:ATP-dependent 26S proteasome regulatory subunit